jgi:hypothetical protein
VKKEEPKSEPRSEPHARADDEALDVPLDLLCEMAWRVGGYDKNYRVERDYEKWSENVAQAYRLIQEAIDAVTYEKYGDALIEQLGRERYERWYKRMRTDEMLSGRVSFSRGCILLNPATDCREDRSIKRFRSAYDTGVLKISKSMQKFENEGFTLEELEMFDEMMRNARTSTAGAKTHADEPTAKKKRGK